MLGQFYQNLLQQSIFFKLCILASKDTSSVLQCCGNFHGWASHKLILLQVIVARPNSYFLRLWLLTYKDYRPSAWYYNAAEAPTKQILVRRPDLITRVKEKFGVQVFALAKVNVFTGAI